MTPTVTAFLGVSRIASGSIADIAVQVREAAIAEGQNGPILIFDDETGRTIDLDLRGTAEEVRARLQPDQPPALSPTRGRPRLGVVSREVTLLPRHWEWLNAQDGGASAALRRLVDAARSAGPAGEEAKRARAAADRFMSAMAGDLPGYEEAARALYAGDSEGFDARTQAWPPDVRRHARALAAAGFVPPPG